MRGVGGRASFQERETSAGFDRVDVTGVGDVADDRCPAAEDAARFIAPRELVLLTAFVLLLVGLLWVRTVKLVPSDPTYSLPRDHHMYAFMATHSVGSLH